MTRGGETSKDDAENYAAVNLPLEVLTYIFRYLPLSDRKNARLVSRQWYEASQDLGLLLSEVVNFSREGALSTFNESPIPALLDSSRDFLNFSFKEEDVNWKRPELWEQYAPKLRSLHIFNCDVRERDFIDILLLCESLESLRTSGCRELLMSGGLLRDEEKIISLRKVLVNLKELWILHNSYLSDALFNRLIAIAPNLKSLSVEGCQVSFHLGLYKKFYPKLGSKELDSGNGPEVLASSSILTFKNILNYITSRAECITSLSFGHTLIDSPALTQLSKVANLKLTSLRLCNCEQLTNAGVIALTEGQPTLKHLDLSLCSRVTDQSLLCICQRLKDLTNLSLRRCRAVTDIGVREIKELTNLVSLDLSQCDQVTSDGISTGLCQNVNRKLQKLYLSGIGNMTEDAVLSLAKSLPNLTHLDLSYCFTAVTDTSVQAIFQHQIWLRVLKLRGCNRVTDAGLTGMGSFSHVVPETLQSVPLRNIDFMGPSKQSSFRISLRSRAEEDIVKDAERKKAVLELCEGRLFEDKPTGFSLARLRGLRHLDLYGCPNITDVSLSYVFQFLELQYLDLSECCQITHIGLKALALNNPSIETLVLSQCFSVCDESVARLTENLVRLKHFDVSGCEKLTSGSVESIATNCKYLWHLDMRRCDRLGQCRDGLLDHVPSVSLPPAAFSAEYQLPTPSAPPLPVKKR